MKNSGKIVACTAGKGQLSPCPMQQRKLKIFLEKYKRMLCSELTIEHNHGESVPSVLEFLVLLLQPSLDLLANLRELQLSSQHLVLLLLQNGLRLFQGSLKFLFLLLEPPSRLFDFVDVATAFA